MTNGVDAGGESWLAIKPTGRLLRIGEVTARTRLSKSQIYQMIAERRFPPMIKLSLRASALPEVWLDAFLEMAVERSVAPKTEEPV